LQYGTKRQGCRERGRKPQIEQSAWADSEQFRPWPNAI
jgi:hypothetical protein